MSYESYLAAFKEINVFEDQQLTRQEMMKALDKLCAKNTKLKRFNTDVGDELWEETPKLHGDSVSVREFVQTIVRGEQILRNCIQILESIQSLISAQIQTTQQVSERKKKIVELQSYLSDYRFLSFPFKTSILGESKTGSQLHQLKKSSSIFTNTYVKPGGSGTDLKVLFFFSVIVLGCQLIVMFQKHHFYSLMAILAVFAIFFVGKFNASYVKLVMINLVLSDILDMMWMLENAGNYWESKAPSYHSLMEGNFLKGIVLLIVLLAFFRLLIAAILFKYRSIPLGMTKQVTICGMYFKLKCMESP